MERAYRGHLVDPYNYRNPLPKTARHNLKCKKGCVVGGSQECQVCVRNKVRSNRPTVRRRHFCGPWPGDYFKTKADVAKEKAIMRSVGRGARDDGVIRAWRRKRGPHYTRRERKIVGVQDET